MRDILIISLWLTAPSRAYRIQGSIDEDKPFVPYEKGFVSHVRHTMRISNENGLHRHVSVSFPLIILLPLLYLLDSRSNRRQTNACESRLCLIRTCWRWRGQEPDLQMPPYGWSDRRQILLSRERIWILRSSVRNLFLQ